MSACKTIGLDQKVKDLKMAQLKYLSNTGLKGAPTDSQVTLKISERVRKSPYCGQIQTAFSAKNCKRLTRRSVAAKACYPRASGPRIATKASRLRIQPVKLTP